jgi:hypothetical protein
MDLTVATLACFVLVFALFVLLVYLLCPEDVTLEASLTKWITLKFRLKSPKFVRRKSCARRKPTRKQHPPDN